LDLGRNSSLHLYITDNLTVHAGTWSLILHRILSHRICIAFLLLSRHLKLSRSTCLFSSYTLNGLLYYIGHAMKLIDAGTLFYLPFSPSSRFVSSFSVLSYALFLNPLPLCCVLAFWVFLDTCWTRLDPSINHLMFQSPFEVS